MLIGVIADDFTGASDIANTLARGHGASPGLHVVQYLGVPDRPAAPSVQAGVVALKTGTAGSVRSACRLRERPSDRAGSHPESRPGPQGPRLSDPARREDREQARRWLRLLVPVRGTVRKQAGSRPRRPAYAARAARRLSWPMVPSRQRNCYGAVDSLVLEAICRPCAQLIRQRLLDQFAALSRGPQA